MVVVSFFEGSLIQIHSDNKVVEKALITWFIFNSWSFLFE